MGYLRKIYCVEKVVMFESVSKKDMLVLRRLLYLRGCCVSVSQKNISCWKESYGIYLRKIYIVLRRCYVWERLQERYISVEKIIMFESVSKKDILALRRLLCLRASPRKIYRFEKIVMVKSRVKERYILLKRMLCLRDMFKKDISLEKNLMGYI